MPPVEEVGELRLPEDGTWSASTKPAAAPCTSLKENILFAFTTSSLKAAELPGRPIHQSAITDVDYFLSKYFCYLFYLFWIISNFQIKTMNNELYRAKKVTYLDEFTIYMN